MYVEREGGPFQLRRGFVLEKNQPVLMVEDIVTTGLSSRECLDAIRAAGGRPVAAACLIDRSGGKAKMGSSSSSLARFKFPAWEADKLPAHLTETPGIKPGSRGSHDVNRLRLGVNIDHVATIRNARGGRHPDPCARQNWRKPCGSRRHHGASARRSPPYFRRRHRTPEPRNRTCR